MNKEQFDDFKGLQGRNPNVMESLRSTDRTTKMLREALMETLTGKSVIVVMLDHIMCDYADKVLRNAVRDMPHVEIRKLKDNELEVTFKAQPTVTAIIYIKTPDTLRGEYVDFDYVSCRSIGKDTTMTTYVDHATIEYRFAKILEQLHRYDPVVEDITYSQL